MVVDGRGDSLIGVAESATQGTVGAEQLDLRPIARAGEVLETVPGLIVTQHAGGGKANQYFLRGFNLDHGTDFYTTLDGMPLNLPTHGHGQGYTDMNVVIPELVQRNNYQKGVYYVQNGDFSSAGAAHLQTFRVMPEALAVMEGGMFGFARGVFADSVRVGSGDVLFGVEALHYDGPWEREEDFQKFNGQLSYSGGDGEREWSLTARGYHGRWDSSDQVAASAVEGGLVPIFGSLNDTTGGESQRYSLQADWSRDGGDTKTRMSAYGFYYDMDLFSDFTYFLTDIDRGDQFEQLDKRWVGGLDASQSVVGEWAGMEVEHTFGVQSRLDAIRNGLYQTEDRMRVEKLNAEDGSLLPATTREDDIIQSGVGAYYEHKTRWGEWLRSVAGVRGDLYSYDVDSNVAKNSGDRTDAIASPKLTLVFGPWKETEFYLQGGLGFHSNDGRGVTARVDPVTRDPVGQADPLVRTYGAEVGVRSLAVEGLQSTVSLWWLDVDSELVFVGDAGTTEAGRPSRRYGVEWANYYYLSKSLILDADFSFSHAGFRDSDPAGNYIPGAIEGVVAAGLTYAAGSGFFGGIRLRYFGPRPLTEDNSFRSGETILVGAQLGYRLNRIWTLSAEVFNLLDRRDHDIDYAYESRVRPGDMVVEQVHFHPVEPIQLRCSVTARF
jgi:hypothetical protein